MEYTTNMLIVKVVIILLAGGLFIVPALYFNDFLEPHIVKIYKSSTDGGRDILTVEFKSLFGRKEFSRRFTRIFVTSIVDGWQWVDADSFKVVRSPGLKFELNCAQEIKL